MSSAPAPALSAAAGRKRAGRRDDHLAAGLAPTIRADDERVRAAVATALAEVDRFHPDELEGAFQALARHGWEGLEGDQGRRVRRRVKALIGVRLEGAD